MMRTLILLLSILFFTQNMLAQNVGIGTDNPHPSAILDLAASDKGLLIPRITTSARNTLATTAVEGLLVYDTDIKLFYYFKNGVWTPLTGGNVGGNWSLNGNNIFKNNSGNVGIGTDSPNTLLTLKKDNTTTQDNYLLRLWNGKNTPGGSSLIAFTVSGAGGFTPATFGLVRGTGMVFRNSTGSTQVDRMVIAENGNVGIGTTLPKEKLEIAGNLQLTNGTNRTIGLASDNGRQLTAGQRDLTIKAGGRISSSDATSVGGNLILKAGSANIGSNPVPKSNDVLIYAGDNVRVGNNGNLYNGDIAFFAGDGLPERMRIVGNTGKIGIGTTNPQAKLHIVEGSDTSPSSGGYIVTGDVAGLNISMDNNEIMARDNGATANLFLQNEGGNTLIAAGRGGQKVGIGTASPGARLDIKASNRQLRLTDSDDDKFWQLSASGGLAFRYQEDEADQKMALWLNNNGNIGIGTTTPAEKLTVEGTAKATEFLGTSATLERILNFGSKGGTTNGYLFNNTSSSTILLHSRGDLFFSTGINGGKMHITENGNIGIGKSNPTKKLEVVGRESESHVMRIENKATHNKADGLEIKINSTTNYENDFIIFSDANGVQGRIEGKTNLININGTDVFSALMKNLLVPPSVNNRDVNNPTLSPPVIFDGIGLLNTVTMNGNLNQASNTGLGNYNLIKTKTFNIGINEDFAIEMVFHGIDLLNGIVSAASSILSIADPEDVFSEAVNLVATIVKIGIYAKYTAENNGIALQTGAGDYAEWLEKDNLKESFSHGDIVGVRAGVISKSFIEADHYMAISTSPAVAGKLPQPDEEHKYEMAAFMGQIPVKVRGIVNKGDYILPSGDGDGLGIAVHPDKMLAKDYHRIVGIAWEASDGKELFKMINTAVGINKNDLAGMVDQMQQLLNEMQLALKEVNPNYELSLYQTDDKSYKASSASLDYTVSPTHHTKAAQYFTNKDLSTQKETLQAVKEALVDLGGIDLSEQPLLVHMLDHPEQAGELVTYYSNILNQFNAFLEASTVDGGN